MAMDMLWRGFWKGLSVSISEYFRLAAVLAIKYAPKYHAVKFI
jgi:hypothetical protein